jgi:biotin transport system substrate-specific component
MSYAELVQTRLHIPTWAYNLLLVGSASLLIAVSAQFALQLPFSPVPVTGQTLAVLLIGALLGRARGSAAVGLYLVEGASGLPVFAGGKAGLAVLWGPTGGYLIGFAAAAYLVGWLVERGWDRSPLTAAGAMLAGSGLIYACGLSWLAVLVGWQHALPLGLYPFLVGDAVKIALAAALLAGSGTLKTHLFDRAGA